LAARARPCAARTRLFGLITKPNGALRAPPPIAASLLLFRSPKIDKKKLSNSGRPRDRLFSIQWTTEAMKYEVLCPRPAHRSFVDPSGNMRKKGFIFMLAKHIQGADDKLGQTLWNYSKQ
jgi:hypothetical protein